MNAIEDVLDSLKFGNQRYVHGLSDTPRTDIRARQKLKGCQSPYAIVLSCADSRVVPELIFDTGIGELFVIRVAGNVPNKCSIASLAYAVEKLDTKLIVVMGHEKCGAVTTAVKRRNSPAGGGGEQGTAPYLDHLLDLIALSGEKDASLCDHVKVNADNSARVIEKALKAHQDVAIVSAYYHLVSGAVDFKQSHVA